MKIAKFYNTHKNTARKLDTPLYLMVSMETEGNKP